MNRSTNLNLYLPGNSDYRDIAALTANFEMLDSAIGALPSGQTLQGEIDGQAVSFGDSSKTLQVVLEENWQTVIPNTTTKPILCQIQADSRRYFGYLSRYSTTFGCGVLVRYDGKGYVCFLSNGTVTVNQFNSITAYSNSIAGNASMEITLASNGRFRITTIGAVPAGHQIITAFVNSSGNVVVQGYNSSSSITYSTATNKITITNGTAYTSFICVESMTGADVTW